MQLIVFLTKFHARYGFSHSMSMQSKQATSNLLVFEGFN
jgi:hypothetical protein